MSLRPLYCWRGSARWWAPIFRDCLHESRRFHHFACRPVSRLQHVANRFRTGTIFSYDLLSVGKLASHFTKRNIRTTFMASQRAAESRHSATSQKTSSMQEEADDVLAQIYGTKQYKLLYAGCSEDEFAQQLLQKRHRTILVEGNIGSGKSTYVDFYRTHGRGLVHVLAEPIELWRNHNGVNMLEKMYENPKKYAYDFQVLALTSVASLLMQSVDEAVKMAERSIYTSRHVFTLAMAEDGCILPKQVAEIDRMFTNMVNAGQIPVDLIVYFKTQPELCYRRMMQRGRTEEANVPLSYLQRIDRLHDAWLLQRDPIRIPCAIPCPVLVVNGDLSLTDSLPLYEKVAKFIVPEKVYDIHETRKEAAEK